MGWSAGEMRSLGLRSGELGDSLEGCRNVALIRLRVNRSAAQGAQGWKSGTGILVVRARRTDRPFWRWWSVWSGARMARFDPAMSRAPLATGGRRGLLHEGVADRRGHHLPLALRVVRRGLRTKCTRLSCQVECSTRGIAAHRPSCASEITSFTPRRRRLARLCRKSVENGSASFGPTLSPGAAPCSSVLGPAAMNSAADAMRPARRTLT